MGHGRGGEISFVFGRQFDNTLIMMICTRPIPTISFSFRNTPFIHAPFTDGQFELCEEIQTQSRDLDMKKKSEAPRSIYSVVKSDNDLRS